MMASWTAESEEVAMLRMAYEAVSPDGPRHWPVVFAKFLEMASTQPTISLEQLGTINAPTLVLAGDDDMIRLEHTAALSLRYRTPSSGSYRGHLISWRWRSPP